MTYGKIIVGVNSTEYNEKRNFIVSRPSNAKTRKLRDLMKLIDYVYFKLFKRNHTFFHNTYFDAGLQQAHLFHFYNTVLIGRRPWIVTYENDVPRHNTGSEFLMKRLAGKSCRKIISMTRNAYNIEAHYLEKYPNLKEKILKKIIVLPPPQQLYVEKKENVIKDKIHFTFVGGAFFHKGGKELVQAFIRALKETESIHLNIVSSFAFTHWYDTEYSDKDADDMRALMARFPNTITYYKTLPNDQIIDLFKRSDVGVLPSYGETYGYAVLEAQACGCPVITTNAWAFSEFNSNEMGWLLELPTVVERGGLKFDLSTHERRENFSKLLEEALFKTIVEIAQNPEVISKKSALAIENIRRNHDVETHREKLLEIYTEALKKN
ncbi:MAG: glycosyltransferase family 4 protein [Bacteroidetes bacterium]|nr:glycosyltransferase family 4 protein [Bacteroidota bacterium]